MSIQPLVDGIEDAKKRNAKMAEMRLVAPAKQKNKTPVKIKHRWWKRSIQSVLDSKSRLVVG